MCVLELTMKCYGCRNKSNYCSCDEPNLKLNTFAFILARQSENLIYVTIKDYEVLTSFLDVSPAESDYILDFVRKNGEFRIVNENMLGSKGYERKKVAAALNKIITKKAIYGYLSSKGQKSSEDENNIIPEYLRNDKEAFIFANGTLKPSADGQKQCITYHMNALHSERVSATSQVDATLKVIFSLMPQ